ncbi:ADP-ribosylglycohydrolase [Nocardioides perillae]|uniref:ADP-ribosylglycohydrolase n=2 Tax=Nocardioides perillae TaxID=1119534 RepID=A0A7Y9RU67_9ACTN|nr:ADP-ribosylglycohydrolase [Nocardioides perillae]
MSPMRPVEPTRLTTSQTDRAAGVLLTAACGDALGVPYEFARPPAADELAEMLGGGLGDGAPGEWSDDTAMAAAIGRVAATGANLTKREALDEVALGFLQWFDGGPPDVGIQTSAVLTASARRLAAEGGPPSEVLAAEAAAYAERNPRSAGNGALMRTGPVALAHLRDRDACARAARAVAELTHADPLAGDSCVLWSEAVRAAVVDGRLDVEAGLDLIPGERREQWAAWLAEAQDVLPDGEVPGRRFTPNGFTVTALQAAVAAVTGTPVPDLRPREASYPCLHLQHALHAAVRIGDDTDSVAAIAGALLGARWGASAVPWRWRRLVHGWPGLDGRDLVSLATKAARGGRLDSKGWPDVDDVPYDEYASPHVVLHPYDDGVVIGTTRTRGAGVDAVVSMCRVGRAQACFDGATELVESRLMDAEDRDANPNLHFVLADTADAVRGLRAEGKRVLLHCVAAQQRTPSAAVAYAVMLGADPEEARERVLAVLNEARGYGRVWEAAGEVLAR